MMDTGGYYYCGVLTISLWSQYVSICKQKTVKY